MPRYGGISHGNDHVTALTIKFLPGGSGEWEVGTSFRPVKGYLQRHPISGRDRTHDDSATVAEDGDSVTPPQLSDLVLYILCACQAGRTPYVFARFPIITVADVAAKGFARCGVSSGTNTIMLLYMDVYRDLKNEPAFSQFKTITRENINRRGVSSKQDPA
ncbi:hypothetical protein J6590_039807 [Homalodisca vitripennis]|nr:hypothetical protein J6590_095623 [Homalodisca vitripennis]KAG8336726.1 hypothetical protein J6590_039807 [Homalodisca vitripennis]